MTSYDWSYRSALTWACRLSKQNKTPFYVVRVDYKIGEPDYYECVDREQFAGGTLVATIRAKET